MNVQDYLARIGLELPENFVPNSEFLRKLQFAHCTTVPYENIDMMRGIPTSMEPEALYRKIVVNRRGGLCFELNGAFGWLLRQLG
jgi:N-hydroxyarylamine O-acetyltransferase